MADAARGWRELTAQELAVEPGGRFGGAIAIICFAAVLVLLRLLVGIGVWLTNGEYRYAFFMTFALMRSLIANSPWGTWLAYMSLIEPLLVAIWAVVFVVAVVWRLRAGATIAAIVFAACSLMRPVGSIIIMSTTVGTSGITAATAQIPSLVVHFVAAVGYWCYMRDGRRPNLYFRRRVPV